MQIGNQQNSYFQYPINQNIQPNIQSTLFDNHLDSNENLDIPNERQTNHIINKKSESKSSERDQNIQDHMLNLKRNKPMPPEINHHNSSLA